MAKRSIPCKDHLGQEYKSKKEMLHAYHIDRDTFRGRMERGWSLEDALTKKVTPKTNCTSHVGETNRMRNGLNATIIADNGSRDITIRFETGEVREHIKYGNFRYGNVGLVQMERKRPEEYIGMTKRMRNGRTCTITEVTDYRNIKVRFDNGAVSSSSIDRFQAGRIDFSDDYKRKSHIGEQVLQNNGLMATLTEYDSKNDVTVRFENGVVRKHINYSVFKQGRLGLSGVHFRGEERIGKSYRQKNGLLFTITEYRSAIDITGKFETGEMREHVSFHDIEKGDVCLKAISAWKQDYLGTSFCMKCGLSATVTDIQDSNKITIRFDAIDESIVVSKKQIDERRCLPLGLSAKTRRKYDFCGYEIMGNPVDIDGTLFYTGKNKTTGEMVFLTAPMMIEKSRQDEKKQSVENPEWDITNQIDEMER